MAGNYSQDADQIAYWSGHLFRRLDPIANAGQFGNEQSNSNDGGAYESLNASLDNGFALSERTKVQFCTEAFEM
jgi:hypothetical protein